MYKADDIAKYVINRCDKRGHPTTNLQLQYILYYLQGYFLGVYGAQLFEDNIYASCTGPTIPCICKKYCYFGADPIRSYGKPLNCDITLYSLSPDKLRLVNAVIDNKSSLSLWELVNAACKAGTPWKAIPTGEIIPEHLISIYFKDYIDNKIKYNNI